MDLPKVALKAQVQMQIPLRGNYSTVGFYIWTEDGSFLTGQQILEAVAEALLLNWDHNPLQPFNAEKYDS